MIREAMLYHISDEGKIQCDLCNHRCTIADSKFGFCGVRQNREGKLFTHAYGEVIAANADPIEKKPLYHFLPGTRSFSIAAQGCNFRCGFCQNWQISQASQRDGTQFPGQRLLPEEVVGRALKSRCRSISYTYTEPTIFFEYAYETAKLAKKEGLFNVFVTNGYMTPEALKEMQPYLDACNVDLKSYREDFYRQICHGKLQPVQESIRLMHELGMWVEITTLVVPDENDDEQELREIAHFIADVDRNIPWHISRFHPDYQFRETSRATPLDTLKKAHAMGSRTGLRYIYLGNVAGEATETPCPGCGRVLIRRLGFSVQQNLISDSCCPDCGEPIGGVFSG